MKRHYEKCEYEVEMFLFESIETADLSFTGGIDENTNDFATDDFDF